jgi:hypothetical protein
MAALIFGHGSRSGKIHRQLCWFCRVSSAFMGGEGFWVHGEVRDAEGIQFMTQKDKGVALLSQRMKQKNLTVVEETYQYFASTFSSPPRMSHDGMRTAIDMLQQRAPEIKFDRNVSRYVDERLLDELEKEGFFKRMGAKS